MLWNTTVYVIVSPGTIHTALSSEVITTNHRVRLVCRARTFPAAWRCYCVLFMLQVVDAPTNVSLRENELVFSSFDLSSGVL